MLDNLTLDQMRVLIAERKRELFRCGPPARPCAVCREPSRLQTLEEKPSSGAFRSVRQTPVLTDAGRMCSTMRAGVLRAEALRTHARKTMAGGTEPELHSR